MFGGNVVRTGTGSAPISREVLQFARSAFACPVSLLYLNHVPVLYNFTLKQIPESYGQTESTFAITTCHVLDPELGMWQC